MAKSDRVERWTEIKGYEGLYEISDMGRVRRKPDGYVLRPAKNCNGYMHLVLREMGLPKHTHIHEACQGKLKQTGGYKWRFA